MAGSSSSSVPISTVTFLWKTLTWDSRHFSVLLLSAQSLRLEWAIVPAIELTISLARRLYGYDLSQAKDFVEGLARKTT